MVTRFAYGLAQDRTSPSARRMLRWRLPPNCLIPAVYQELSRVLELLNVCAASTRSNPLLKRPAQVAGERPGRWTAKCRVYHHAAPPPGVAKDAFLVALDAANADAHAYVVLRRASTKRPCLADACAAAQSGQAGAPSGGEHVRGVQNSLLTAPPCSPSPPPARYSTELGNFG